MFKDLWWRRTQFIEWIAIIFMKKMREKHTTSYVSGHVRCAWPVACWQASIRICIFKNLPVKKRRNTCCSSFEIAPYIYIFRENLFQLNFIREKEKRRKLHRFLSFFISIRTLKNLQSWIIRSPHRWIYVYVVTQDSSKNNSISSWNIAEEKKKESVELLFASEKSEKSYSRETSLDRRFSTFPLESKKKKKGGEEEREIHISGIRTNEDASVVKSLDRKSVEAISQRNFLPRLFCFSSSRLATSITSLASPLLLLLPLSFSSLPLSSKKSRREIDLSSRIKRISISIQIREFFFPMAPETFSTPIVPSRRPPSWEEFQFARTTIRVTGA